MLGANNLHIDTTRSSVCNTIEVEAKEDHSKQKPQKTTSWAARFFCCGGTAINETESKELPEKMDRRVSTLSEWSVRGSVRLNLPSPAKTPNFGHRLSLPPAPSPTVGSMRDPAFENFTFASRDKAEASGIVHKIMEEGGAYELYMALFNTHIGKVAFAMYAQQSYTGDTIEFFEGVRNLINLPADSSTTNLDLITRIKSIFPLVFPKKADNTLDLTDLIINISGPKKIELENAYKYIEAINPEEDSKKVRQGLLGVKTKLEEALIDLYSHVMKDVASNFRSSSAFESLKKQLNIN